MNDHHVLISFAAQASAAVPLMAMRQCSAAALKRVTAIALVELVVDFRGWRLENLEGQAWPGTLPDSVIEPDACF